MSKTKQQEKPKSNTQKESTTRFADSIASSIGWDFGSDSNDKDSKESSFGGSWAK